MDVRATGAEGGLTDMANFDSVGDNGTGTVLSLVYGNSNRIVVRCSEGQVLSASEGPFA